MISKNLLAKIDNIDLNQYRKIKKIVNSDKELLSICNEYLIKYPELKTFNNVLYFIQKRFKELPRCLTCGKTLNFNLVKHFNAKYCSLNCANKNKNKYEKSSKTNLKNQYFKLKKIFKDYVKPIFTEDEYIGRTHEYKWKCVKCRKYIF